MYQGVIPIQNKIMKNDEKDSLFYVFYLVKNEPEENLNSNPEGTEFPEMSFSIRKNIIHISALSISEENLEKEVYSVLKTLKYLASDEYRKNKYKNEKY